MKRSGFKPKGFAPRPAKQVSYTPRPREAAAPACSTTALIKPAPKQGLGNAKTAGDRRHMSLVAQLGCMACKRAFGVLTPLVELHHPRRGAGAGIRSAHVDVVPLCFEHHRGDSGVHGLGTKGFERLYGFGEEEMLADVRALIGASGVV